MSSSPEGEYARKFFLITDQSGSIIAVAGFDLVYVPPREQSQTVSNVGLAPLAGQRMHLVEMPDEYFELKTAAEKYEWLQRFTVEGDDNARLIETDRMSKPGSE
jgi:hypothetical protein